MSKMQRNYKGIDFPQLTSKQSAIIETLKNLPDEKIDLSDISECDGTGGFYYFQSLKLPQTKIYTAIDNDNLEWLKQNGKGYQKRLNNLIRWARLHHCPIESL